MTNWKAIVPIVLALVIATGGTWLLYQWMQRQSAPEEVVMVDVERISDSCGFGVPLMEHARDRDQLERWAEQRRSKDGADWKAKYVGANNARSIDGLPGIAAD